MSETILNIPLADIITPQNLMRKAVIFEGLEELSDSIRSVGLLNPITVRQVGEKYELVAGFRRMKACEIIGLPSVPCRITPANEELSELQRAHENIFREDVNPIDEAEYFRKLMNKYQWSFSDLALAVKKSVSYVSDRIALLEGDPEVLEAVRDKKIGTSIARELLRIDNPQDRHRLLWYAINSGASLETVRRWRVDYEIERDSLITKGVQNGPILPEELPIQGNNPALFKDSIHPNVEIQESLKQYRTCFGCSAKVDLDAVYVMFLCSKCRDVIVKAITPQKAEVLRADIPQGVENGN